MRENLCITPSNTSYLRQFYPQLAKLASGENNALQNKQLQLLIDENQAINDNWNGKSTEVRICACDPPKKNCVCSIPLFTNTQRSQRPMTAESRKIAPGRVRPMTGRKSVASRQSASRYGGSSVNDENNSVVSSIIGNMYTPSTTARTRERGTTEGGRMTQRTKSSYRTGVSGRYTAGVEFRVRVRSATVQETLRSHAPHPTGCHKAQDILDGRLDPPRRRSSWPKNSSKWKA